MNKKLVLLCIITGAAFSIAIFSLYAKKEVSEVNEKLYFIQYGAYKNKSNVVKVTKSLPSYVVIEEDGLFKIYISILKTKENIDLIKANYPLSGVDIFIREVDVSDKSFIEYISKYDELLKKTRDKKTILKINASILKKYESM